MLSELEGLPLSMARKLDPCELYDKYERTKPHLNIGTIGQFRGVSRIKFYRHTTREICLLHCWQ